MRAGMGIVLANWKAVMPLIGGRWTFVLLASIPVGFLLGPLAGLGMALAVLLFLPGWELTTNWGEVANKPFSFLLPGYRGALRRLYFSSTVLTGLGMSFYLLGGALLEWRDPHVPHLSPGTLFLNGLVGFAVGMALPLVLRALPFAISSRTRRGIVLLGFPLTLFVFLFLGVAGDSLLVRWGLVLPMSLALCILFWVRLGDMHHVGQGHRLVLATVTEQPDSQGVQRGTPARVRAFFQQRMRHYAPFSVGRSCWAALYRNFTLALACWRTAWVVVVGCTLILGFAGEPLAGLALIFLGLVASDVYLPLEPDPALLLPAGRRERCLASGVIAIGVSLLCMVLGLAVIALSWFFWLTISAVSGEHAATEALTPIDPGWFYWPCLAVPWVIAARLFTGRAWRAVRAGSVVVVTLLFGGTLLLSFEKVSVGTLQVAYAGALLGGWLLLLATLWMSCRLRDFTAVDVCARG